VRLLTQHRPRDRFLATLGDARVVVVLPNLVEGFCLPALEAMALGAIVVIPDVVGNRSFCIDGVTCLMPEFENDAVVAAAERALASTAPEAERFRSEADRVVAIHTLDNERTAFHSVLARLDDLWAVAAQSGR
jgi:glycosyltransferase involved in cell wall biosynthesis